ncbi:hypothetical protein ACIP98_21185 [Streptomyces sp. NPDC088354]|uniref:hypothetical protein n=1 Tax=Streptomyces sp. NPDC088354 TaxID=3365856 RepID=UPI00381D5390
MTTEPAATPASFVDQSGETHGRREQQLPAAAAPSPWASRWWHYAITTAGIAATIALVILWSPH